MKNEGSFFSGKARYTYNALPVEGNETEPRLNIVCWRQEGTASRPDELVTLIFPRSKHRPDCYYAEGKEQLMISPGALDMCGLFITPREQDFNALTSEKAQAILQEVTLSPEALKPIIAQLTDKPEEFKNKDTKEDTLILSQEVSVGIMKDTVLRFCMNTPYHAKGNEVVGEQMAEYTEGGIRGCDNVYQELTFRGEGSFTLHDVTIGQGFHWERKESQTFQGVLKLVVEEDKIVAINVLPVEDYLKSVISSEMKSSCSLEYLKAAAVISRSWLYAMRSTNWQKR